MSLTTADLRPEETVDMWRSGKLVIWEQAGSINRLVAYADERCETHGRRGR